MKTEHDWAGLKIPYLRPDEAEVILRNAGLKVTAAKLRRGLEQGKYPFGEAVQMESGKYSYCIYERPFWDWCKERDVGVGERDG